MNKYREGLYNAKKLLFMLKVYKYTIQIIINLLSPPVTIPLKYL